MLKAREAKMQGANLQKTLRFLRATLKNWPIEAKINGYLNNNQTNISKPSREPI